MASVQRSSRPFLRQVWSHMITDPQALVRPSEPPASAGGRRLILDRSTSAFLASSGVLIVAGGAVAAVNSAAPFGHGSWLAAYLVLVGGVSQVVLGAGRLALRAPRPTPALLRAQLVLWNLGSLAVPAGVLADAPTLVTEASRCCGHWGCSRPRRAGCDARCASARSSTWRLSLAWQRASSSGARSPTPYPAPGCEKSVRCRLADPQRWRVISARHTTGPVAVQFQRYSSGHQPSICPRSVSGS
jgi:hypothetical protein